MNDKKCGLIAALDVPAPDDARSFLDKLGRATEYIKIGPRLYALGGVPFIRELISRGYKIFLDLKLHDIPNTVASAVEPLSQLGLWALTLHTSGGCEMMARSVAARDRAGSETKLFGITVLTSLGGELWEEVHPGCDMGLALVARAEAAKRAGLDGIVCSPLDLDLLKGRARKLMRVVPGIRAKRAGAEDQARVATAKEAALAGATYVVVGRPILEAADPVAAAKDIIASLEEVSR